MNKDLVKLALLRKIAGVEISLYGYPRESIPKDMDELDITDLRYDSRITSPYYRKTSGKLTTGVLQDPKAWKLTSDFSYGPTKDRKLNKQQVREIIKLYKERAAKKSPVYTPNKRYEEFHKAFVDHAEHLLGNSKAKFYRLEWH